MRNLVPAFSEYNCADRIMEFFYPQQQHCYRRPQCCYPRPRRCIKNGGLLLSIIGTFRLAIAMLLSRTGSFLSAIGNSSSLIWIFPIADSNVAVTDRNIAIRDRKVEVGDRNFGYNNCVKTVN